MKDNCTLIIHLLRNLWNFDNLWLYWGFWSNKFKIKSKNLEKIYEILTKFWKNVKFFWWSKIYNRLSAIWDQRGVLAQLVEKCQAIEHSNFQVQQKVKNQENTWSEITCVFQRNEVPKQIVRLSRNFACKKCRPRSFWIIFQKLIWGPWNRDMSILYVATDLGHAVKVSFRCFLRSLNHQRLSGLSQVLAIQLAIQLRLSRDWAKPDHLRELP